MGSGPSEEPTDMSHEGIHLQGEAEIRQLCSNATLRHEWGEMLEVPQP